MRDYFVWLAKIITLAIVILIVIPALIAAIRMTKAQVSDGSLVKHEGSSVAVVELTGVIMDPKEVIDDLYDYAADAGIQGIVLRIDSQGGSASASQEVFHVVKKLREKKPIVVSLGSVAASGGLYAAMAGSKVLAQPSTMSGSIGVIVQIPNVAQIAERVGVSMVTIKSGALKDVGNVFRPMTDEERVFLQGMIDATYLQFVEAVASSRGLSVERVKEFADGRIILGSQAKEYGLIDGFGDIRDAARLVFELKGAPLAATEEPKLVRKGDEFKELRRLFQGAAAFIAPLSEQGPRLMYLMH